MNHHFFTGSSRATPTINLGASGRPSSQSSTSILANAASVRQERDAARRRDASARTIQRVWRGASVRKGKRAEWRSEVDAGEAVGVEALRRVVFGSWESPSVSTGIGAGNPWWENVAAGHPPSLLLPLHSPDASRYVVLLRILSLRLLGLGSRSSHSSAIAPQLAILPILLTPSSYPSLLSEADAVRLCSEFRAYLVAHDAIRLIAVALRNIAPTEKKHVNLPPLISTLCILLADPTPALLESTLAHILPLPLLPNRLPIPSITLLAKSLPLKPLIAYVNFSESSRATLKSWGREPRLYALGNLAAFGAARLTASTNSTRQTRDAWCELLAVLLRGLDQPIEAVLVKPEGLAASHVTDSDDDEDNGLSTSRTVQRKTHHLQPPPPVPAKLLSHLALLSSKAHLDAILSPEPTPAALALVLALLSAWPKKADDILLIVGNKRGILRDLWRGEVRGGKIMRMVLDDSTGATSVLRALKDPQIASSWSTFLLLTLLHAHLLHTFGDDEFFSPQLNPLTLDETASLSSIWRNVAFALYWNGLPEGKTPFGWNPEEVRTVCERAMNGVLERDLRRPFLPDGHWLMTESFDVKSFVEAAILEEQSLESPEEDADSTAMTVDEDGFQVAAPRPPPAPQRSVGGARRNLSKRQLAFLSPKLGVLNNIPQTVPFEVRVEIFRAFIRNDRKRLGYERYARGAPKYEVSIRRTKIAEDGYAYLNAIGAGLKSTIAITFIDQWGQAEAGIDGGGVFKEFLTSLSTEVFNTDRGLWQSTKQQELFPAPTVYATERHQLDWFQFIGRVLGKALYEGILADVAFSGFFLNKWLGRQSYLDDLSSLDEELYRGLIKLKQYDGDFDDLALTFTVTVEEFGTASTIELVQGGSQIAVTKENRLRYIDLVANFKLNIQLKSQCEAFFMGLADIISPKWIRMFNSRELQMLVGGVDTDIDIDDLRANSVCAGLSEQTERAFWSVVKGFTPEQRRQLVKFVTSCPRPPMLGFKELEPLFCIRAGANDVTRLPSSATCVNLLKLPPYKDEATLRSKLLQAISSDSGFDLS